MTEKYYVSKNRINLNDGKYCPPHRLGEGVIELTISGEKITNEPCHFHPSRLSMILHHIPFCKMLRCPHYNSMIKAYKTYCKKTGATK